MDVFSDFLDRVHAAIQILVARKELPAELDLSRIVVEWPRDPAHGDIATNAAMPLARLAAVPARDLAKKLAELLAGRTMWRAPM